jgi:hypothetical protein
MTTKEPTRAEIHAKMLHTDEKMTDLRNRIARAGAMLRNHNKHTPQPMFNGWHKELERLGRERQRLQFAMGEARRPEKAEAAAAREARYALRNSDEEPSPRAGEASI